MTKAKDRAVSSGPSRLEKNRIFPIALSAKIM